MKKRPLTILGLAEVNSLSKDSLNSFDSIVQWIDPDSINKLMIPYGKLDDTSKLLVIEKLDSGLGYSSNLHGFYPQKSDIEKILKHTENKSNILIACHMGISRSTATAIGVLIKHFGFAIQDALAYVQNQRKICYPNERIISFIDDLLDLDYNLIDTISKNAEFPYKNLAKLNKE